MLECLAERIRAISLTTWCSEEAIMDPLLSTLMKKSWFLPNLGVLPLGRKKNFATLTCFKFRRNLNCKTTEIVTRLDLE